MNDDSAPVSDTRRVAIITGGTRGIGLGIARRLAREGFDLVLNGVRPASEVTACFEELESLGAAVEYVQGSIAEADTRQRLLRDTGQRFGRLHVLVNNAGVGPLVRDDVLQATEESWDRVLGINLKGPYFLTQAAANWMISQKEADPAWQGCIVNVTSISAAVASVNRGEYCVSKAGLSMASMVWAVRLADFGISVYEVRPGIVATDMVAAAREKYDRLIEEGLLLQRRWGQPDDVGRTVAALVRGDLGYSTGSVINVDGGMTVSRL